jgi:hypothetical protein
MDYHNTEVEKITEQADRSWIDGFEMAIGEIDDALANYEDELDDSIPSFKQLSLEIAQHFADYLRQDMLRMRDGMIDSILDEQATKKEAEL